MADAKQGKVYARFYIKKQNMAFPVSGFLLDTPESIFRRVKKNTFIANDANPDARFLIQLAKLKYKDGGGDNPFSLLPLYIYPKECQVKKG